MVFNDKIFLVVAEQKKSSSGFTYPEHTHLLCKGKCHCTADIQFVPMLWIQLHCYKNICNWWIQSSQTGGQRYSDTYPTEGLNSSTADVGSKHLRGLEDKKIWGKIMDSISTSSLWMGWTSPSKSFFNPKCQIAYSMRQTTGSGSLFKILV